MEFSDRAHIDLYDFLLRRKTGVEFPVERGELDCSYKQYKSENGSIRRCVGFFVADLLILAETFQTNEAEEFWQTELLNNSFLLSQLFAYPVVLTVPERD